jgi:hypothetical protein
VKTAIVLASGLSLTLEQIDAARRSGHFTLTINATYQKFLDANAVYMGDFLTVKVYAADVAARFKGTCWTQDSSAAARWPKWRRVRGCNREGLGRHLIHQNGNSGFQAINLVYLWGYKRIVLLGFDMKPGPKGEKHHHADHPAPCVQNQTFDEWLHKSVRLAKDLKEENCEVINATPGSAMRSFPMADWREVLA